MTEDQGVPFIPAMAAALVNWRKRQFRRAVSPLGSRAEDAPRFLPDTLVWVSERFRVRSGAPVEAAAGPEDLAFHADFLDPAFDYIDWRGATALPRRLSRLTLEIGSVRIERVQAITDEDVMAEGVVEEHRSLGSPVYLLPGSGIEAPSPREVYARIWNYLQGGDSWSANPFVYRCEIRRVIKANVDRLTSG